MQLKLKKICIGILLTVILINSSNLPAFAGGGSDDEICESCQSDKKSDFSDLLDIIAKTMGTSVATIRYTCPDLVSVEKAYESVFAVQRYKFTTRLGRAIADGDLNTVKEIVGANPGYLNDEPVWQNARPDNPDTALCLAVKLRKFEIVEFLTNSGATNALHCRYPRAGEFRFPIEYIPYGVLYTAFLGAITNSFDVTDVSIIECLLSHGFMFYDEYGCECPHITIDVYRYFEQLCGGSGMGRVNCILDKYGANLR